MEVQNSNSIVQVEANGGDGGMINNGGGERCHGPGGGGSGGRIISNLMVGSTFSTSLDGGQAGVSINSSTCSNGTNGAENGEAGILEGINNNIFASQEFLLPEANFSYTNEMLAVTFTNLSQNSNTTIWNFGDGNSSSNINPIHTYAQTGTYNVQLIISNDCGVDTFNQSIFVEIVEANFAIDEDGGCLPHTVNFQNNSLGTIDDFLWTFEGGNPATSNDENPQIIYDTPGLFDVQLEVYGTQGIDTIFIAEAIEVLEVPNASFDFSSPIQGTVNFNNNSTNATSFDWDFGDGSAISNEEMPIHIYNSLGNYVVTLTASNEYCSNTFTDTVSIITSIDELELSGVSIFPNPTSDYITIELQELEIAQFEVYSIDGRRMEQLGGEILGFKKLNISAIPAGVYVLSVFQNGKRGIYRWIKLN